MTDPLDTKSTNDYIDVLLVKRALTAALNWLPNEDQDMDALTKVKSLVHQALEHIKERQ